MDSQDTDKEILKEERAQVAEKMRDAFSVPDMAEYHRLNVKYQKLDDKIRRRT